MNSLVITDSTGKTWKRVDKRKARRYYELDKPVILCPINYQPFLVCCPTHTIKRDIDFTMSFDNHVNSATIGLCDNFSGLYLSFYVRA